jgi:Ca2+-transporting ATPase
MKYPGLSGREAIELLALHGPNQIAPATKRGLIALFFEVMREPMLLLLVAAGIVNFMLAEPLDAWMLIAMVSFVIGVTLVQGRRTERAVEALRNLTAPLALVVRDGEQLRISSVDLVPGDIILVAEGDRVAADAVLLTREICELDESALTGESVAVQRSSENVQGAEIFAGTTVTRGHGVARVISTGANTRIGQIGSALASVANERTRLQREIDGLVKVIAVIGVAAAVLVTLTYGLTRGNFVEGLLAGIATAMAMLPEEFPVVLTVFMAFGTWRMAKRNVLVRKPAVIEALGSVSVICADKTGTITQNRMELASLSAKGQRLEIESSGKSAPLTHEQQELLRVAHLACPAVNFDPTDLAIRSFAEQHLPPELLPANEEFSVARSYPMTSELSAMGQVVSGILAVKGAPEALARICAIEGEQLAAIEKEIHREAGMGRRVIGVAVAETLTSLVPAQLPGSISQFSLRFLGLLSLHDPVRPGVAEAVLESHAAGIRTIMITGDYPETAAAIGREIGLESSRVVTGAEISEMTEGELAKLVRSANIFARMIPEQKLRLVRALQSDGEVVAMTGDGVNDGPSLKAADVGIAMGKRGTEVAREAAHMVLTDDDFSSIVRGVRAGRGVYQNLQKALSYVIAVHVPMLGMALVPIANPLWPLIMLPVLVAFLELVIDPACSIAFESEPADSDLMQRKPRNPKQRMFSLRNLAFPLAQGVTLLFAVLLVYFAGLSSGADESIVRTLAFTALMAGNLMLIVTNRSWNRPAWRLGREHRNPKVYWVLASASLLLIGLVFFEPARTAFRMGEIAIDQFLVVVAIGGGSVCWVELVKWFRNLRPRATDSHRRRVEAAGRRAA